MNFTVFPWLFVGKLYTWPEKATTFELLILKRIIAVEEKIKRSQFQEGIFPNCFEM
jgi:hypothetical protein